MKNQFLSICLILLFSVGLNAAERAIYTFTVDLTLVKDDKVKVVLIPPKIKAQEITYFMPKIIPGTYWMSDYGRYVHDLKAFDNKGNELIIEKTTVNSWKISKANKLVKLTYWVSDSFDADPVEDRLFGPAGTNIEEGKNFVINSGGFFGYFEGMTRIPFKFNVIRDSSFYGSTGLKAQKVGQSLKTVIDLEGKENTEENKKVDTYLTDNYDQLIDNPLMYCVPDTTIITVGGAEVLISSYSPNQVIRSEEIKNNIEEILTAQKDYLGGELPVDKYAFILYFSDDPKATKTGALEHSYSSMYFQANGPIAGMSEMLNKVAAHEFFHIVTPLNIHSEEIHQYNFNEPKMSQHLWLYEGVTEFFASNVQVKYGIMTREEYLQTLRSKMVKASTKYNDTLAFTDLSKYTLEKYSDQFPNVYQKGALIGMCLDIKLRSLSEGKYGVQDMMADLSKKYGKDQPFKDEELFDVISLLTYPEIGEFLSTFVAGSSPLPFDEILSLAGVDYVLSKMEMQFTNVISPASVGYNREIQKFFVRNESAMDAFGKSFGFENGDVLILVNDKKIPHISQFSEFLEREGEKQKVGKEFSFTVLRKGADGKDEEVKLVKESFKIEMEKLHILSLSEEVTPGQLAVREGWLGTGK